MTDFPKPARARRGTRITKAAKRAANKNEAQRRAELRNPTKETRHVDR